MSKAENSHQLRGELRLRAIRQRCRLIVLGEAPAVAAEAAVAANSAGWMTRRPTGDDQRADDRPQRRGADWTPSTEDVAWAAGLFVGEGYCGLLRRGEYGYVTVAVQMLDDRAVARFAAMFGRKVRAWPLHYDRTRLCFKADASGKAAEAILAVLWPYIEGTAKGDQVRRVCEEVGVMAWVDGTATTPRPLRRGNRPRGPLSEETKRRISEARKRYWEERRRNA